MADEAQLFFAAEIFYILTITFGKFSILLLYCSLFQSKRFALYAKIIAAVVVAWAVGSIFGVVLHCVPVEGYWDLQVRRCWWCIDSVKFFAGNAIPNIITDTAILVLPMPKIWHLQLSTQRKIVVSGMFLVGSLLVYSPVGNLHH